MDMNETIKTQLAALQDGSTVVIIVPAGEVGALLNSNHGGGAGRFEQDLTLEEYRAEFAPKRSLKSISEWCRKGLFPCTVDPDDPQNRVPGAYLDDNGEWRITRAGIRARQDRARRNWLSRRTKDSTSEPADADVDDAEIEDEKENEPSRPISSGTSTRPKEGAWRSALKKREKKSRRRIDRAQR